MKNIFKSVILYTIISTCLSGCSLIPAVMNMNEEKYYCPKTPDNSSYSFLDLYVPSDDCSGYKLFNKAYNDCIKRNSELKARFDAGKCEKVIVKEHRIGGAKCKVELIETSQRRISTSCIGNNTDRAMEKIRQIYK